MDHHEHHGHHDHDMTSMESPREYMKFAGVIIAIILISIGLSSWRGWSLEQFLGDFMGTFLVVFAIFKIVNLEMFALTYRGYDIITKRLPVWGYIFPFVELALGLAYLFGVNSDLLDLTTIIITAVASIGVVKELTKKSKIMCACLGTIIRLPLSKISFVEDFLMLGMATYMLIA